MEMTNFREKIVRWTPRWVMAGLMVYIVTSGADLRVAIFVILVNIFIEMAAIRDIMINRAQDEADHRVTHTYTGTHV